MNIKQATCCATAVSLALLVSTSYAADDETKSSSADTPKTTMTGKQKATAIGAGTGAVAGAVVGGPIGAVVGAGIGGYVGHEGTDANGKVSTSTRSTSTASYSDSKVRDAQAALNSQGYDAGAVDGQWGPNTQSAVRRFQAEKGLAQTGKLDTATLNALGVNT